MQIRDWARSIKPALVDLQARTGIPALFAAAQFCHESHVNGGLSRLATDHHNYAGLKWAVWQAEYGCQPVRMGTWEVIDGQRLDVVDAFCSVPSWAVWLEVYAALLTGDRYGQAREYAADPLLYALHVWRSGWATDPAYLAGIGGWMSLLWADYADTIPRPPRQVVTVTDAGGRHLCDGWLELDRTAVFLRDLADSQGLQTEWYPGGPTARLVWPGQT
ncbi:MAG TPA: glucosaminidase domain-containing protein [Symbiobacteriaceae bacterium]|nr:glucosaminidase domain-containing protein [Symbiobacteriaceae bacterium]